MRLAIDIGGTFTDAVAIDDDGHVFTAKTSTTPSNLAEGVINAIRALNVTLENVTSFIHGTTAGLNALLERRGANVALLTTRGFRDVYAIGRANRPEMYNARYKRTIPLVRRPDIYEVNERKAADGSVLQPIQTEELVSLCRKSLAGSYEAIAVCLLHSYKDPAHEQEVRNVLTEELDGIPIVLSSDVAPEWREYERTSTTVVSAYVAPIIGKYLSQLEQCLEAEGIQSPVLVMQSNGGVVTADVAKRLPVQTLLSGPVGGTTAGVAINHTLESISRDGLICIDMGGTSFDVSMVVNEEAQVELESSIDGHDLLFPSVAIHTVGAGGGSVAEVVAGGLRVGPRSAGAMPGPACYGRGGTEPTVTDANLLLGRLSIHARLCGDLELDSDKATQAVTVVGQKINMETTTLSEGIVKIADGNMANAIRELTVFRGLDPRDYALMAFGGAGPLHAVALAEELEISTVVVPAHAGVLSAWGMLQADYRVDLSASHSGLLGSLDQALLESLSEKLSNDAKTTLSIEKTGVSSHEVSLAADLRYLGQEYTLTISIANFEEGWQDTLKKNFDDAYLIRFGHCNEEEKVEMVNLRVTTIGYIQRIDHELTRAPENSSPISREQSWSGNDWADTPVYRRDSLPSNTPIDGPSMVLEPNATTYIPHGWQMRLHELGHLLITKYENNER
ncbi:MAG: hydantoinase/oxoprolinase family protein [Alphaproteobacteria bacterium]